MQTIEETTTHRRCYGTMFPDVLAAPWRRAPVSGKVFAYELRRGGELFPSGRSCSIRIEEWDDCRRCPEFDDCYKLSMATLALQSAIENR